MFLGQPWYVWLVIVLFFICWFVFILTAEYRIYQKGGDAIWFGKRE